MYNMKVIRKNGKHESVSYESNDKEHVLEMLLANLRYKYIYKAPGYRISRKNNYDGTETYTVVYTEPETKLHWKTIYTIEK